MKKEKFDALLNRVASAYRTTPDKIRIRVARALEEDAPESIPHAGSAPTLEEFVEYLAETLERPYLP